MTSYDDSSIIRKSSRATSSPVPTNILVNEPTHLSNSQSATLIRRLVGVIRIFSFFTITWGITLSIEPEPNKAKVDSDYTLTKISSSLDMERPWARFSSEKLAVRRIVLSESIFWRCSLAKSISHVAIWSNLIPAATWARLFTKSYFSTHSPSSRVRAFPFGLRPFFFVSFRVFFRGRYLDCFSVL